MSYRRSIGGRSPEGREIDTVSENEPLYARVQSALRTAIRGGQLAAGDVLPSEKDLEAAHGVSRITVRRALEELEREGLVVRGRGRQARVAETFVSAVRAEIEEDLAVMLELVRGTQSQILTYQWRLPTGGLNARLGTPDDEPVLQVDRLRSIDGRAMLHTSSFMPASVGARLQRDKLNERPMLESLSQSGVSIASAEQEMRAAPCPAEIAPLIGLQPGDPVFIIERLVSDKKDEPVQHLIATFRWDSFCYRIMSRSSNGNRRVEIAGTGLVATPVE